MTQALLGERYRLDELIGRGGMASVWRATDTTLGREVAIKILPTEVAGDPERIARFEREARVLAALNHPGIAAIHGLHAADGVRFLAMELVPGVPPLRRGSLTGWYGSGTCGIAEADGRACAHRASEPL